MTDDLFGSPGIDRAAEWAALRKSNNPYAYYSVFGEPEEEVPARTAHAAPVIVPQRRAGALSKRDFQHRCRRIFRQYVPPTEGHQLRPHYRDFITRNEGRSPEERFLLLEALGEYDISTSGNFQPHFNREQDLLTAAKLQQIEATALKNIGPE